MQSSLVIHSHIRSSTVISGNLQSFSVICGHLRSSLVIYSQNRSSPYYTPFSSHELTSWATKLQICCSIPWWYQPFSVSFKRSSDHLSWMIRPQFSIAPVSHNIDNFIDQFVGKRTITNKDGPMFCQMLSTVKCILTRFRPVMPKATVKSNLGKGYFIWRIFSRNCKFLRMISRVNWAWESHSNGAHTLVWNSNGMTMRIIEWPKQK